MDHSQTSFDDAFKAYNYKDILNNNRVTCLVGALIFIFFIPIEMVSLSTSFLDATSLRIIPIAALLAGFVLTYQRIYERFHEVIHATVFLFVALGITDTIYSYSLEEYQNQFSKLYLATMLIYIMGMSSWSYFNVLTMLVVALGVTTNFAFVEINMKVKLGDVILNSAFLLSTVFISAVSLRNRNKYRFENFLLAQSLENSLDKKTIEADENAYLANHDALTGLPNRRYATSLFEESLKLAKKTHQSYIIMFIDLNGFKAINDNYGHHVGDAVLLKVARRLETALCRNTDTLSRLGGDEYLIGLYFQEDDFSNIETFAKKLSAIISNPMNVEGVTLSVGASIGCASYPSDGDKIDDLIEIADKKMYSDKNLKNSNEEKIAS